MLKIENLSYQLKCKPILKNVSFKVNNQQFIAIIGANGAGKSTLLKCIAQMLLPTSGEIFWKFVIFHYMTSRFKGRYSLNKFMLDLDLQCLKLF